MEADVGVILPQYGRDYDAIRDAATDAERYGYDGVWLEDHLQSWIGDPERDAYECWTTLSALAEATERIRIGSLVTCQAYRHPSLLAKMAASVDRASGGRLDLGLGAGWYEAEFERFGYEFREPPAERIRRLRETVEVLRGLWTNETYTHRGEHFDLDGAFCRPEPVQEPHPPVWIGGGGERFTLRYAAELADGWNYGTLDPDGFAEKLAVLRDHCETEERYRNITKSAELFAFVADDREAAERKREGFADRFLPDEPSEPRELFLAGYLDTALVGTPEDVRAQLERYEDVGIESFMLSVPDAPEDDSLALLAEAVT
ncbi:LLM class flavin-dependent oxidoreductase [Haladaptatus salinisoli]|uniref:LLM class flavin-dependent oxidoreductase n=1 Tax=Haladaptatus salinisoli TaxID=2884876 RepID=UPI001D0B081D|nr:TIGR03560 family F420-dependent LLM class oxidoreductase [Haladaptatus salinisoli]